MEKTNSKMKRFKPVYFNLNNPEDLELFNKANTISNFNKWVKDHLREIDEPKKILSKDDIKTIIEEILNNSNKINQNSGIIKENPHTSTSPELDSLMI